MEELKLGYNSITIQQALMRICNCDFLLPSIQRDVAWTDLTQISDLFDSIYKGYPVNPILLLKMVKGKNDKLTTLYQFNLNTDNNKLFDNQRVDFGVMCDGTEKYLVLDGQQRLTALYRGLRKSINNKKLYFNAGACFAIKEKSGSEDGNLDREFFDKSFFSFRTDCIANVFENDFWVGIYDLYDADSNEKIISLIDDIIKATYKFYNENYNNSYRKTKKKKEEMEKCDEWKEFAVSHKDDFLESIMKVRNIFITSEDKKGELEYNLIDFDGLSIEEQRIRLLSIFVRFNMGGEPLKPADLLYSQLAVATKIDDIKSKFKDTMEAINKERETSNFKLDHFMRLLWLVFGTSSFKTFFTSQDVQKCSQEDIEDIKEALIKAKTAYLNAKFNFEKRVAYNMFLPIAYYFYQTKDKNFTDDEKNTIQVELAKYYSVVSLTGYISGQSDSTLNRLKKYMSLNNTDGIFENDVFNFGILQNKVNEDVSTSGRKLGITENIIDEFLEYEYGEKNDEIIRLFTFLAKESGGIYRLFPDAKDIDHMHPKKYAIDKQQMQQVYPEFPSEVYDFYCQTYNKISNLQMLNSNLNRGSKNDKPLKDWVGEEFSEEGAIDYMKKQYICSSEDEINIDWLEFENYKYFYEMRKNVIKEKLCKMFGIK